MKKILFSLAFAAIAMSTLRAQTTRVRSLEFELRVGATAPLSRFHGGQKQIGPTLGVELRNNLKNSPIDIGVNIDITTAVYYFNTPQISDCSQSNRTAQFGIVLDYNLNQGATVNPFFGVAFGFGQQDNINEVAYSYHDGDNTKFVSPRVGVELSRHFRATLAANLSCHGYSNASMTVGYVIGGGKKK